MNLITDERFIRKLFTDMPSPHSDSEITWLEFGYEPDDNYICSAVFQADDGQTRRLVFLDIWDNTDHGILDVWDDNDCDAFGPATASSEEFSKFEHLMFRWFMEHGDEMDSCSMQHDRIDLIVKGDSVLTRYHYKRSNKLDNSQVKALSKYLS